MLDEFQNDYRSTGERKKRGGYGVVSVCKECRAEKRSPGLTSARRMAAELRIKGLKKCSACGEILPIAEFHIRRLSADKRSYKCAECIRQYCRDWREKHPDAFREWHQQNKVARAEYWQDWYRNNKSRRAESYAIWARANKHIVNSLIAKRNAAKKQAMPAWANLAAIRSIYERAVWLTQQTGIRHEVDHIYPLQGKLACGLHCEANLQILTKAENIRKKNRMPKEFGSFDRNTLDEPWRNRCPNQRNSSGSSQICDRGNG